jgi:transcriptional regulator with XRE-family HTH domain
MSIEETHERLAKIKYELALRNYTQSDVAAECGVEATTVGAVIHGRSRSKKIEVRIASITHLPLAYMWPQWHGPDVKPRRRRAASNAQLKAKVSAALHAAR